MTITLDDVLQITGLSITGKILDGSSAIKREEASKLLQEGLGLDKNVVEQELERCKGGDCIIQTDWIKENFKGKENVEDDGKVDCAVRAYLMYMIGCVLLPDKSGTMMSASYMRFLLDISKIHEYAWGASALAYLYRQMGFSSRCDVKQLAGYLPLLEVWVYEHFPIAKGILNPNYVEEMPRMRRWKAWAGSGRSLGDRVCDFRQELDLLTPQS
ncbi:serine/threonine-protein phosphatase 7 long form-like protein, partial [Thalictrum thalictroides]